MPEGIRPLTEIFSHEQLEKINQLVSDLKKIRIIDKTDPDIEDQIARIAEQEYFYVCDFAIRENLQNDKEKLATLWGHLRSRLS